MKKLLLLLTVWMLVSKTYAEENYVLSFTNEIGCRIDYSMVDLIDILATCDTIYEEKESDQLILEYDKEFPASGPEETAVLILAPDDKFFNAIFIQEDTEGEILTLRILTEEGWLECDAEPYSRELMDLACLVSFVQHILEVEDSPCPH